MYFNYFLPGRTKVTIDELRELGLGYVFDPETAASPDANPKVPRAVVNGPGGQHGLIVSPSSEFCGYFKDQQVWKQEIDCDYWVGMWRDKRPTPETLARENQIYGSALLLDDGHFWSFPMARHYDEFDGEIRVTRTIACALTRNEAGLWLPGEPKKRYRELWRLATEYQQARAAADTFSELDNLVVACFQANYRVSAIELDLLGIYDDDVRARVPRILMDDDSLELLFKKKLTTPGTGNSTAGPLASLPAEGTDTTDQPAAT